MPPQAAQVPPAGAYGPAVPVWPGPPQGTYSGIQGGYGAPPYGAAYYGAPQAYYGVPYPGYGAPPPKPPRKKMGLGLKVFLWIASVLAAGTILGFTGFLVYSSVTNSYGPHYTLPEPGEDTPDDGEKTPDFGMERLRMRRTIPTSLMWTSPPTTRGLPFRRSRKGRNWTPRAFTTR